MINPQPRLSRVPLGTHEGVAHAAIVLDDFLLQPEALIDIADRHQAAFVPASGNAFPGPELPLPDSVMAPWVEALSLHARAALGARRVLSANGRLSIVTLRPDELSPVQRLCHRDRLQTAAGEIPVASVVYLFEDAALGGTAFYRPKQALAETNVLMQQVATQGHAWLDAQLGKAAAYMTEGNAWFEQTAVVPAAFNRAIFYRGDLFHTSHLLHPERLHAHPRQGRLTMNGFFVCRRHAS